MKQYLWLLLLVSSRVFSWGTNGHLLVAEIAYQHLTPAARAQVNTLSKRFTSNYPRFKNFQLASVWADSLRHNGVNAFNSWHSINQPLSYHHIQHHYYAKHDVVWAILQSIQVLQSPTATPMSKALFLMFLNYFVADAHQPLHCVNFYSRRFPNGDSGGTLFLLKRIKWAANLHQYWDKGGDILWQYRHSNALNMQGIKLLATKIEKDYPETNFSTKANDLHPYHWVEESYLLAKNTAYHIPYNSQPSKLYQAKTQKISEQRFALAGYRLENLLNQIYRNKH